MRDFIWNEAKTAIIKVKDISSIKIHKIANDIFQLEAKLNNGETYILNKLDNIRDAKQKLANWEDDLVYYCLRNK